MIRFPVVSLASRTVHDVITRWLLIYRGSQHMRSQYRDGHVLPSEIQSNTEKRAVTVSDRGISCPLRSNPFQLCRKNRTTRHLTDRTIWISTNTEGITLIGSDLCLYLRLLGLNYLPIGPIALGEYQSNLQHLRRGSSARLTNLQQMTV